MFVPTFRRNMCLRLQGDWIWFPKHPRKLNSASLIMFFRNVLTDKLHYTVQTSSSPTFQWGYVVEVTTIVLVSAACTATQEIHQCKLNCCTYGAMGFPNPVQGTSPPARTRRNFSHTLCLWWKVLAVKSSGGRRRENACNSYE